MTEQKRVMLLGGGGAPAVNIVKAVKRASHNNYWFLGVDINLYHQKLVEDYFDAFELIPSQFANPTETMKTIGGKYKFLQELIHKYKIDMVMAQPDCEVFWLSAFREHFQNVKLFLPSHYTIITCQNKHSSEKIWAGEGIIKQPSLRILNNLKGQYGMCVEKFGLPFWVRAISGAGARGALKINSYAEYYHWLGLWKQKQPDWIFVAQEYYTGGDFAYESLWHEGQLICGQGKERLEYIYPQHSPSGLTGTPVAQKVCNNKRLEQVAVEAIEAIDKKPHGVFSVDLKLDKESQFRPTEINAGRFFTSSKFFAEIDKNMPLMYLDITFAPEKAKIYHGVYEFDPNEDFHYLRMLDCGEKLICISAE